MGCALCRWVYPGIMVAQCSSALLHKTVARAFSLAEISSISSRSVRRMSSATWSFLERAVWSRLPVCPSLAVSSPSTKVCMSSACMSILIAPLLMSFRISFKPSTILLASPLSIIPVAPSIVACAIEPFISCSNIRQSKPMDELKSLVSLASSFLNLPFHNCAIKYTSLII